MSQGAAQSWDRIKREVQTPRPRRTQLEQLPAEEALGPPLRVTLPAPQGGDQEQRRRNSGPSPPSTLGSCPGATTERWARMDTCEQSLPTFWGGGFQEGHTEQSPGRGSRHPRVQGTSVTPPQIISSLCPTLHPESHFHCVFFRVLGFCANGGFLRPLGYPQKLACLLFWQYPPPIYFRGNSGTCDKEGILAGHRPGFSGRGAMMGERGGESRASIFLQRNKVNQISIQIRHWSSFDNIPNSCKQGSLDN